MRVYAYYRVSTDMQDYETQKIGVVDWCVRQGLRIDKEIIDNGISGTVEVSKRKLGNYLPKMTKGDWLVVSELSRIGRSTSDVINTCQKLNKKGVNVYFLKQNIQLDNSPMGKMFVAILAAFAEMERDLIVQRTKEGIEKARRAGKQIGRKYGFRYSKLDKKQKEILMLSGAGATKAEIARLYNISWITVYRFLKRMNLNISKEQE